MFVSFFGSFKGVSVIVLEGTKMDASQQFWMSEDLLEQLLPMLDLSTTVAFASVNSLALSVLFRPLKWRRFLKRSFKPTGSFRQEFRNAHMITDLLEMANSKESRLLGSKAARESQSLQLLDFVDHICQVFPGLHDAAAVSYTHLTLPTKRIV